MTRRTHIVLSDIGTRQADALRARYNLGTLTDVINFSIAATYWETFGGGHATEENTK